MTTLGAYELDSINHCDLFALCDGLPDASVDMVLCDLPYGTTACSWDTVIPFAPMWERFRRVIKPRGAIVLTATDPFSTVLKMSNWDWYKYSWVWVKSNAGDAMNVKNRPMRQHEDVCVFSEGTTANKSLDRMPYYPQGLVRSIRQRGSSDNDYGKFGGSFKTFRPSHHPYVQEWENYPTTILKFPNEIGLHPTQKPVALFEYLIRTYTREGDVVLDPCVGSGTTALAARNAKRHWICGDSDSHYCDVARDRLRLPFEAKHVKASDDVSDLPLFASAPR